MRKASKILCLIGGILGIILAVVWLVVAIVYLINGVAASALASDPTAWPNFPESIREFLTNFSKEHPEYTTMKEVATALLSTGILFIVMFLFSIPCAIISFIVSKKEKTGLPLPIVLVALSWSGNVCSFVGGVLAIVNWAVVERKE